MDLITHVSTFVAAAEARSFTRAAEALEIPQPLLSRRIRALETAWGGALFERTSRQVTLTPLAELALPAARNLMAHAERLAETVATGTSDRVREIGLPRDLAPAALAQIISAGTDHGLALGVREVDPHARAAAFADGGLDLALLADLGPDPALTVRLGLARPDHGDGPPSAHLDTLRPRRGQPGPTLWLTPEDDEGPVRERLARAVAQAGLADSVLTPVGSTTAAVARLLAEGGHLICPAAIAARHELAWTGLDDPELSRRYRLATGDQAQVDGAAIHHLLRPLHRAIGAGRVAPEPVGSPAPVASG